MPIVRKKLAPSDVYPTNIRYDEDTDTVQSLINGDWVDSPEADPRHQTTLPPRITSNTRCDAAQSVVDALQGQIDAVIVAIDNSSTAFTIAGIILSLFSFGVFAVLISLVLTIADAMIAAGSSALEAALTSTTYHTFMCIIYCEMDGNGRIDADGLNAIMGETTSQIGGLAAVTLNSMLHLAGEGGVNNLAALGTSTGDCSDCGTGICDLDLWDTVYLGTVTEIGFDYIEMQSVNVPSPHGDHRISIGTSASSVCCAFDNFVFIPSPPTGQYEKFYPCGRDFTTPVEDGFEIGFPVPGTEVWVLAVDATEPFTVRLYFTRC